MLLVIVRGLPGSGKSTLASELAASMRNSAIINADAFRYVDGVYKYDPALNQEIHARCHHAARASMAVGDAVIVDNINHKAVYWQPYLDMAQTFGYTVTFATPATPWAWDVDECFRRGTHGVPREVIQRVKDEWESMT